MFPLAPGKHMAINPAFAAKPFETHPSGGAKNFRIENKKLILGLLLRPLIPLGLSVRIHAVGRYTFTRLGWRKRAVLWRWKCR